MQPCFCIKGVPGFDFYIKTLDTDTLVYNDLSQWVTDEPYIIPTTHEVEVTLPDSSVVMVQVKAMTSTILKSSDFNIGKFKDGIYTFHVDSLSENSGGCGYNYTKFSGIYPNIECCIDNAYSKLDESKFPEIKEVESWLNRSKISASLNKEKQALDEWKVSKRLLQKLNCECSC